MQQTAPENLQKPGAGLPFPTSLIMRYYYGPFVSKRDSWETLEKNFERAYAKIWSEASGLNEKQLETQVLIPPQRGLEDSSRFWSVAMTLEHLVIVGEQIQYAMIELSQGRKVSRKADIAQVKPLGQMGAERSLYIFENFKNSTPGFLKANLGDRQSKLTHVHPWFGPFNVHQWFWILGGHAFIHVPQIKAIKKGL